MVKISKIWFDEGRIWMETDSGKTYSRPLEAFPVLMEATDQQRLEYKKGKFGDDVRWPALDEDIHISSFTEDNTEPVRDNEIGRMFAKFPQLNVSEIARTIGINKSLLSKYIYGIKKPSDARKYEIFNALRSLGQTIATENERELMVLSEKRAAYGKKTSEEG